MERGLRGFESVTIVGVGLIGGSIGLAIKERGLARRVVGVGHRWKTLRAAVARGVIDEATLNLGEGARGADLVVVATPIDMIAQKVRIARKSAGEKCILVDVGSSKRMISRELRSVKRFIPSHPIAGSEQRGNLAARGELFEGALCVVTPGKGRDPRAVSTVRRFWRALGMRVVEMTPARHDAALAATSHLPHVVAAALVLAAGQGNARFAGTGFRDTTRVAGGDPRIWKDVLLSNADKVADSLGAFGKTCRQLERVLRDGDEKRLVAFLMRSKKLRDEMINDSE